MSLYQSGELLSLPKRKIKLRLYTPHSKQLEIHNSKSRFRVCSFGRQAGKSTGANNELLKHGWENPNSVLWYISPTYDSAKIMFRRAVNALSKCNGVFRKKPNETELLIPLINGTDIFYKSGEVLENLRTETLNGVIIDEVRNQNKNLWPLVIRPMLTTTQGWAMFISTPNGFDHFYDLANHAKASAEHGWEFFTAPSVCNPLITEEEILNAKGSMSENEFAQEYLAEFRDITSGRSYVNFSDANIRSETPIYEHGKIHPLLPIIIAMDFNLSPMAWNLCQKRGDVFYVFDKIWLTNSHTQEASKVLVEKLVNDYPHVLKTGVLLAGDATSNSGQRAAAGQSDYDIVCQALDAAGIKWENITPESNPNVKDRVNTVNAHLKDANGNIRLFIHPDCKELIDDFYRVVWKQNANGVVLDQVKDPMRTHASDGIGYMLHILSPLSYMANVPKMRIINR